MKLLSVAPSTRKHKKLAATFKEGDKTHIVHFGDNRYRDYTKIEDKAEALKARTAYRTRHAKEEGAAVDSPGMLSLHILWGDSTSINANVAAYKKRFHL